MLYEKIKYNLPKIDSFTLLIPIDFVDVVSSTFLEEYEVVYKATGEIEQSEHFYKNYIQTKNDDFKTFLKYKKIKRIWNGELVDFIQIMITSKLLKSNYFDGINLLNFDEILNYINSDGVINITLENAYNSYVVDIDICKDFKVDLDGFKALKKMLVENVLPEKESLLNSKKINSKDVFGVQYNERHKATPSKPFAKLYFKSIELKSEKTLPFTNRNLEEFENEILKGIARFEVTVKSSKHKEKLEIIGVKTLKDLLALENKELERVYNLIIQEYYSLTKRENKKTERMTPTELMISNLIKYIIKNNKEITTSELIFISNSGAEDKKQKHVIKQKTLEILSQINAYKEVKKNDEEKDAPLKIMQNLGIFEPLD